MEERERGVQYFIENIMCVCYTNLMFLLLLFVFIGFSQFENCCQIPAIILQYNMIICAVLFNCTVLMDPKTKRECIPHIVTVRAEQFGVKAVDKMLSFLQMIQKLFSWAGSTYETEANVSLNSSTVSACASEESETTSNGSFQSPEMNVFQKPSRDIAEEKAQSEPTKKATSYLSTKIGKLDVKDKCMQLKSPELFKNKIYQIKKSLLNGHSD